MNILALVPARRNSVGLKFKNRKKINNISLTRHAIKFALKNKMINYVALSTDDEYLINENKNDCMIINRPQKLSTSYSCSFMVWRHAIISIEKKLNINFDLSVLLEPTSPLRTQIDVANCLSKSISLNKNIVSVTKLNKSYSPEKLFLSTKNNKLKFYHSYGVNYNIRQKIQNYYYRNGVCYVAKCKYLKEKNPKINFFKNSYYLESRSVNVNIDTKDDFAQFKKIINRKSQKKKG